jgi:hypothetical protein
MAKEFKSEVLNKYQFKVTMGQLLKIQRTKGINILGPELFEEKNKMDKEREILQENLDKFLEIYKERMIKFSHNETNNNISKEDYEQLNEDTKLQYNQIESIEDLNKEEQKRYQLISKEQSNLVSKYSAFNNEYKFKLMCLFADKKEIEQDEDITVEEINEFWDYYLERNRTLFNPKKKDEEEDTGK